MSVGIPLQLSAIALRATARMPHHTEYMATGPDNIATRWQGGDALATGSTLHANGSEAEGSGSHVERDALTVLSAPSTESSMRLGIWHAICKAGGQHGTVVAFVRELALGGEAVWNVVFVHGTIIHYRIGNVHKKMKKHFTEP